MRNKTKDRQAGRTRREWYLSHGICPHCGRNDLQKGYKLCLECRTAHNDRRRSNYKPEENQRERHKALREQRIAEGLCPKCGKRKPDTEGIRPVLCVVQKTEQQACAKVADKAG